MTGPEWGMFLLGLLPGYLLGGAAVYWLMRDPRPKPHKHNWMFTACSDGVLRTCVECGESDVTLFKDMPGQQISLAQKDREAA